MSDLINAAGEMTHASILRVRLENFLKETIALVLTEEYRNAEGFTCTGRNMNELAAVLREAGYTVPGTNDALIAFFKGLDMGVQEGFRKAGSKARFGAVVTKAPVEVHPMQVWERIAA